MMRLTLVVKLMSAQAVSSVWVPIDYKTNTGNMEQQVTILNGI